MSAQVLGLYLFDDTPVNKSGDFPSGCSTHQQRRVVAIGDGLSQTLQQRLVETLQVHSYIFNWKPARAELFNGTVALQAPVRHLPLQCDQRRTTLPPK